jgi:hypothetical protein
MLPSLSKLSRGASCETNTAARCEGGGGKLARESESEGGVKLDTLPGDAYSKIFAELVKHAHFCKLLRTHSLVKSSRGFFVDDVKSMILEAMKDAGLQEALDRHAPNKEPQELSRICNDLLRIKLYFDASEVAVDDIDSSPAFGTGTQAEQIWEVTATDDAYMDYILFNMSKEPYIAHDTPFRKRIDTLFNQALKETRPGEPPGKTPNRDALFKVFRNLPHIYGADRKNTVGASLSVLEHLGFELAMVAYAGATAKRDGQEVVTFIKETLKRDDIAESAWGNGALDEDIYKGRVRQDGVVLRLLHDTTQMRQKQQPLWEQLVELACPTYGRALQWATDLQKQTAALVLAAVKNDGMALKHAQLQQFPFLRTKVEIALAAVMQNGRAISLVDLDSIETEESQKKIVLAAVKNHGMALRTVASRVRGFEDDDDVVLAAVKQNGFALQFASPRLKENKDVAGAPPAHPPPAARSRRPQPPPAAAARRPPPAVAAVTQTWRALRFVERTLRFTPEIREAATPRR